MCLWHNPLSLGGPRFSRFAFLLAGLFCFAARAAPAANRPNILLVTLDTVRADRMGFMGSKRGLTPNLDGLARQSTVFSSAYAQAPLTTASHATILSGTYPQYHGVNDFGVPLPPDVPTVAEILRRGGYQTAAFVGSLILDPRGGLAPGFDRGFDIYDAGYHVRRPGDPRYPTMERRAEDVVRRAAKWLAGRSSAKPFFLWVHLYDAHDPYDPPEPYATRYRAQPYDGEIAYVDASVGRLLAMLAAQKLMANTAIVVTSDHGESLGEHGEDTHGIFLYDETIHVPLLLKMPDGDARKNGAGNRVDAKAELVDVAPTLLEVAGIARPAVMQGVSLTRLSSIAERPAYSETDYPRRAFHWSALAALRKSNYLYVRAPRRELYNVRSDQGASHNLAPTSPAIADTMAARLEERRHQTEREVSSTPTALMPEQAQNLTALGYVVSTPSRASGRKEIDPKDKLAVANALHHAILSTEDGRYEEALPLLRRVVASDPDIYIAQLQLGIAYARRKDYAAALPALQKALELNPESGIVHEELGLALYETGDTTLSGEHFEEAVKRMPRWADAQFSLASVYARTARVPEAIQHLKTALELEPQHYRANLLLGRILSLEGDPGSALPNLQEAVKANPQSREGHLFLADAYQQLGMVEQAQKERAEAQRLPPPVQQ